MDTPPPGPGVDENQKVNLTLKKGEYIGYVKNGVPNGNGVFRYNNGNVWEGNWVNGKMFKGDGFIYYVNAKYEGHIDNSMRNGQGKYTGDNNLTYNGSWVNDKRDGTGKCEFEDGSIYEGDWKDDIKNGQGKMTYKDRSTYEGGWINDNRSGYGKYIDKSEGAIYEGEWKYDIKNGQGKMTYKDGSNYEGGWYGDKKHGEGKLTDADGKCISGIWEFDKLAKKYPILKVSSDVFDDGVVRFSDHEEWGNNDIIMLYNSPKFDVTKTIDSSIKKMTPIYNYIFTREEIEGLERIDKDEKKLISNPYNRELMDPQYLKLYVLSITGPPVSEVSSAGGKRKIKRKRKQTIKRKQKSKRIQINKKTKRNLH